MVVVDRETLWAFQKESIINDLTSGSRHRGVGSESQAVSDTAPVKPIVSKIKKIFDMITGINSRFASFSFFLVSIFFA